MVKMTQIKPIKLTEPINPAILIKLVEPASLVGEARQLDFARTASHPAVTGANVGAPHSDGAALMTVRQIRLNA